MSQVTIQGNAAGTGIFTIAAPNSNTNRSLALPDASGEVVVQGNTQLRVNSLVDGANSRGPVLSKGYAESVFTLTGTTPSLNPANGSIQTWTLTANSSPTDGLLNGESLTLLIDDGTAFAVTWPSVVWKTNGGVAPTLLTTGLTVIVLWKVGTTLYGARVGDA